jgi:hypothetical protein
LDLGLLGLHLIDCSQRYLRTLNIHHLCGGIKTYPGLFGCDICPKGAELAIECQIRSSVREIANDSQMILMACGIHYLSCSSECGTYGQEVRYGKLYLSSLAIS